MGRMLDSQLRQVLQALAAHYKRVAQRSMRCEGHDEKYLIYYKDLFSFA